MNAQAQTYFIHPQFQAQRTTTPTLPLTFRLDANAKEIVARCRAEMLRQRIAPTR
jgi:hypothetical protein